MSTAEQPITVYEPRGVVQQSETASIISMIERVARDPGVDIDKLERLLAMQERIMAQRSRTAYVTALAEMQPELPIIVERGKIDIGRGKPQMYALWEDINEGIRPVLSKHGFSLSFKTGRRDDKIIVTGILSHRDGHSEETTMELPVDASGSKNAVQAIGSSTSYGKRYTASALLNLTSRGEDDDGKAAGGRLITAEQVENLKKLTADFDSDGMQRLFDIAGSDSLETIPAGKYAAVAYTIGLKQGKAKANAADR